MVAEEEEEEEGALSCLSVIVSFCYQLLAVAEIAFGEEEVEEETSSR